MDKKKIGIVAAVVVVLFLFLGFVWPGFLKGAEEATTAAAIVEEVKDAVNETVEDVKDTVNETVEEVKETVEEKVEEVVEEVKPE